MPMSSNAVMGEFNPTPFQTHTTKLGEPLETVRANSAPDQFQTDLSTVNGIPSNQTNTLAALFSSNVFRLGLTGLLIIVVGAAVGIPLGIILSSTTSSPTNTTMTTTMTTTTGMTTTTANTSSINSTSLTSLTSLSTSTTVTTTTTTTTTTTVTTTTVGTTISCGINETVYGVWNTTAGGNSIFSSVGSSVGNYYTGEIPQYACNNIMTDRYTSYGPCSLGASAVACGLNTGFYRTPPRGASLIIGLQVCTVTNDVTRDPLTVTLEGSNQPNSSLNLGSSWTLIYSGPSGLATDPGRSACGIPQLFLSNSVWYYSYRFLVTSKRGLDSATAYAEVQLIGY